MNSLKATVLLAFLTSIANVSAAHAGTTRIDCKIIEKYGPTQVAISYQDGKVLAGYVSSENRPLGKTSVRTEGNTYIYGFRVTYAVPVPQAQRQGYSNPTFWQQVSEDIAEAEEYLDGSDDSFMERERSITHIYYNSANPAQSSIEIQYLRASRTSFATLGPFRSEGGATKYPLECSMTVAK